MKKWLGPKPCTNRTEYLSVIELINNVFRISDGYKPTMQYEFPYLLSENNMGNMILIKLNNQVISVANYLKRDIIIENSIIKTASIGAVSTHPEYRGKRLSSKILDKIEEKMIEDGVELALVSGTRSLYTRRSFVKLDSMYRFKFNQQKEFKKKESYQILDYKEKDLIDISRIYNQTGVRFKRNLSEFKTIINSRPFNWGDFEYKRKTIKSNGRIVGYLILQIIKGKKGIVIEAYGDKKGIEICILNSLYAHDLEEIIYDIHKNDINSRLNLEYEKGIFNKGSFKIMNFKRLISSLKEYFTEYCEYIDEIEFIEEERDGGESIYSIKLDDEIIKIKGRDNITKFIFGNYNDFALKDNSKLKYFIEKAFPVPLPYTENLNYQ